MPWRKREQAKKIANEILIEAAAIIVVFVYVCKPFFCAYRILPILDLLFFGKGKKDREIKEEILGFMDKEGGR